jgi:hypothetical protein
MEGAMRKRSFTSWVLGTVISMSLGCSTAERNEGDTEDTSAAAAWLPAATGEQAPPAGYRTFHSVTGVACHEKIVAGGQPDYVCELNLDRGRLRTVHGSSASAAPEYQFQQTSAASLWSSASRLNTATSTRAVMFNASMFSPAANPTGTAFPYKQDRSDTPGQAGSLLNYGYTSHPLTRLLSVWSNRGSISAYTNSPGDRQAYAQSSARDVIAGLDPSAQGYSPNSWIPRTFTGLKDSDGNGTQETVLVYASRMATQAYATTELMSGFGAAPGSVVMFDGGGSTALYVNGVAKIDQGRRIPNAIVFYSGR